MENPNGNESFNFTYSAKEQEELRKIREKYSAPAQSENKMEQLRRLDAGVTQKATRVSLALGIIGALILGSGMSLAMTSVGAMFGLSEGLSMAAGIVIGIMGIILVCLASPTYNRIVRKEREKIAPEILRLTEELMK